MSRAPTLQWQLLPHSWLPERPVPRWGAFPGGFTGFADCGCGSRLIFLISLRPFSSLHPRESGGLRGGVTRGAGCWAASSGESGPWSLFLAVSKGNGETVTPGIGRRARSVQMVYEQTGPSAQQVLRNGLREAPPGVDSGPAHTGEAQATPWQVLGKEKPRGAQASNPTTSDVAGAVGRGRALGQQPA